MATEHTRPADATRQAEKEEAGAAHTADRVPTPEEEAKAPTVADADVAENYREMTERGASQKGEGRI